MAIAVRGIGNRLGIAAIPADDAVGAAGIERSKVMRRRAYDCSVTPLKNCSFSYFETYENVLHDGSRGSKHGRYPHQ